MVFRSNGPRASKGSLCLSGHALEALEPRVLLTTFADVPVLTAEDLSRILAIGEPRTMDTDLGPLAVVGDIDGDGVPDILTGRSGAWSSGRSGGFLSGANLYSGRTGELIRSHSDVAWSVAALGDVDGDGVPDYGLASGPGVSISGPARVYSGATGALLHEFSDGNGSMIAAAGDVDGDGRPDILVGFPSVNAARIYSGSDGSVLRDYSPLAGLFQLGRGVVGGVDLDGDGVPDAVVAGSTDGSANLTRLAAFSGADGSLLYTTDLGLDYGGIAGGGVLGVRMDLSQDFTGDGVADILLSRQDRFVIVSGATGQIVRQTLAADVVPAGLPQFSNAIRGVPDQNGDGVPEIAVGAPRMPGSPHTPAVGAVLILSGADDSRLGTLTLRTPDESHFLGNSRIGHSLELADMDGDGRPELLATGGQNSSVGVPGFSRLYIFGGDALLGPEILGFTTAPGAGLVAWGRSGDTGFLHRAGGLARVADLPGFLPGDIITAYAETASGILIGGVGADGGAFVYTSTHSFMDAVRRPLADAQSVGGPAGEYTDATVVAASANLLLVQRTRVEGEAAAATAWLYDAAQNTLTYLFDGVPVAISAEGTVIGRLSATDGVRVPLGGEAEVLEGFLPTVISGLQIVGLVPLDVPGAPLPARWGPDGPELLPTLPGGDGFIPTWVGSLGDVAGTYTVVGTGERSAFYIPTPLLAEPEMIDLRDAVPPGAPAGFADRAVAAVIGGASRFLVLGPDGAAALMDPYTAESTNVPPEADLSLARTTDRGDFFVGRNRAGRLVAFFRAHGSPEWTPLPLGLGGFLTGPHLGEILTWDSAARDLPFIALATTMGLLLLEPLPPPEGETGERYRLRNLTEEAGPGALAAVRGLVSTVPPNGLRLLVGLAENGDLVIYGENLPDAAGHVRWSYQNLFDDLVRPAGDVVPDFAPQRGGLVAFTTPWGAVHIIGSADGGQPVAFWTAPGIVGWRSTNLSQSTPDEPGWGGFRNISAAVTEWNAIHVFGDDGRAMWWAPGFNATWRSTTLRAITQEGPDSPPAGGVLLAPGPRFAEGSMNAFTASWGALHVVALESTGDLRVYWWSPGSTWRSEILRPAPSPDLPEGFTLSPLAGRLHAQETDGRLTLLGRDDLGQVLAFTWSVEAPAWVVDVMAR